MWARRRRTFTAKGADGKQHSLRDYAGKLVVLEWTSPVCPFHRREIQKRSNAGAAALRRLAATSCGFPSIRPHPTKPGYLTAAAARARIAQTHATVTAFLFDVDGNIARSYGAKTTPSFFVVDRDGKLAYRGRHGRSSLRRPESRAANT